MKKMISLAVEEQADAVCAISDDIFDHPELGCQERYASALLTGYLEKHGFKTERGAGGLETAFRAEYENGAGGPSIGLLCEYDAIKDFGHGCAHHMQGPAIIAAAQAIKKACTGLPYKIVVYGTPDEEISGGKIAMKDNGCFREIDVALMMHGSPTTTTDVKCMALRTFIVTFRGKASHAAIAPEKGRSALDALMLACHGVECLREHVQDDTRLHYGILDSGGPTNIVHPKAVLELTMRSYDTDYVMSLARRAEDIIKGAALMGGVTYEISETPFLMAKIPVLCLNEMIMDNARLAEAPTIRPPRDKTGSTDFGNVMYDVPGSCIRVAFVPEDTASHSQEFLDAGKSQDAHNAVVCAAKILAMTAYDLISDAGKLNRVKSEFAEKKRQTSRNR